MLRFILFFLAFAAPYSYAKATPQWEKVSIGDESYITIRSIKKVYGFQSLKRSGNKLTLEKDNVRVELRVGQKEVYMNRIKFFFSFAIRHANGRHLVHSTDLVKLLDPVLRPNRIPKHADFNTVIIDPGHGGHDPGAVSPHDRGREKDYTLAVSHMLAKHLLKRGYKVGLTRQKDRFLSLQERVDYANRYPNAIFISLHFNSASSRKAKGIETFTLSPQGVAHYGRGVKASDFANKPGNTNDSANIALATAIHSTCIKQTGLADRGVRRARYSVISKVKHPAILLEGGFLSNSSDSAFIKRKDFQERLASSIADAVSKYKLAIQSRPARR